LLLDLPLQSIQLVQQEALDLSANSDPPKMVPAHVSSLTGVTRKLLIALDFGTTMTAIAWCQTARVSSSPL
jgi:hypothetical protein